ncbi:MAG: hypothetical protein H7A21_20070 [Spirochaetales bacterium]|nr:hypothetical protein [Leptospiraceae bacterium]MCP5483746.1 hypothetical protein [Spirochaetales bacterium]MCP5484769.1 hypothetical protein [Spirochaetales bacterium]
MDEAPPLALILVAAPLFFVCMWCGVLLLLSFVGGWHFLAGHFAATGQPPSDIQHMLGGMIGLVSYRGVLSVSASPRGLYLATFVLFRPGHPALLIPRHVISDIQDSFGLLVKLKKFKVQKDGRSVTIRLPAPIVDKLDNAGGGTGR